MSQSEDSLSFVDERLAVEHVCRAFSQHVKFWVSKHEFTEVASSPSRNTFIILMNSQRALDGRQGAWIHPKTRRAGRTL